MPVVPVGAIAIWSGTLAGIPAGWIICDGSNSTPDLRDKFVKGAAAGVEAGATGGAVTHNHTEQSAGAHTHAAGSTGAHTHTVGSAGGHEHGVYAIFKAGTGTYLSNDVTAGAHTHTTTSVGDHTHTADSQGSHTHTINSPASTEPPYYKIVYIWATASATVAVGIIIIWTGLLANIPANWALCDGGGSRPDLRASFIKGAAAGNNAGGTGGGTAHNHSTEDSIGHIHGSDSQGDHFHGFSAYSVNHNHGSIRKATSGTSTPNKQTTADHDFAHTHSNTNTIGAHTHTFTSGGIHNHGNLSNDANNSLPTYYDVAFIYNSAAVVLPVGGILIWTGLIANIPAGFDLCNGGSEPDLRGYYVRGSAAGVNPGGTGGSNTHIHTDNSGGNNTPHTQDAFSTAHQHSATGASNYLTDNIGAHQHGTAVNYSGSTGTTSYDTSAGDHQHAFTNDAWSHTHTVSESMPAHTHTIDPANGEPPYYVVQFIYTTTPPVSAVLRRNLVGMGL